MRGSTSVSYVSGVVRGWNDRVGEREREKGKTAPGIRSYNAVPLLFEARIIERKKIIDLMIANNLTLTRSMLYLE